jgi:hypothetical protein
VNTYLTPPGMSTPAGPTEAGQSTTVTIPPVTDPLEALRKALRLDER